MSLAALNNANDHEIVIYVQPLRNDVTLDCELVATNPGRLLTPEAFGEAQHWLLPPRANLAIMPAISEQPCHAARIGGEGIEARVLFISHADVDALWEDMVIFDVETLDPAQLGPAHVGVSFEDGERGQWIGDESLIFAPSTTTPTPSPGCEAPSDEQRMDWSTPAPRGDYELLAVELGIDGCHELQLQPVARVDDEVVEDGAAEIFYLCAPPERLGFEVGEELDLLESTIWGVPYLWLTLLDPDTLEPATDAAGTSSRLVFHYRDAAASAYLSRAFEETPELTVESDCPWLPAELGCATMQRRVELFVDGAVVFPGAPVSVPYALGAALNNSLIAFAQERAVVDEACSEGAPSLTLDFSLIREATP